MRDVRRPRSYAMMSCSGIPTSGDEVLISCQILQQLSHFHASPFTEIVRGENYGTLGERDKRKIQRNNQEARVGQPHEQRPKLHSVPHPATTTAAAATTTSLSTAPANSSSFSTSSLATPTVGTSVPAGKDVWAGLGESGWVPVRPPPP